jgi:hypothetical protein
MTHKTIGRLSMTGRKPFRDKGINGRIVPCPYEGCLAPVGEPCTPQGNGKRRAGVHPVRRRMAVRLLNQQKLAKDS